MIQKVVSSQLLILVARKENFQNQVVIKAHLFKLHTHKRKYIVSYRVTKIELQLTSLFHAQTGLDLLAYTLYSFILLRCHC
jgi:hypothetical protein